MEPIKFEENVKDKLNKRKLKPSKEAWNKLSKRLEGQEKKSNNKPIWWMGLAASIVGVLFVVSQFLNDKSTEKVMPQVVDTPGIETIIKENKASIANEDTINNIEDIKRFDELLLKKSEKTNAIVKEDIVAKGKGKIKNNGVSEPKIVTNIPAVVTSEKLTFEEETIQHVVAEIKKLKDYNTEVTDEEIDMLLLEAQKEITLNKLYNDNTKMVDADLLLQDVEADLDQSFRSKVFETLKASYNTVKTAVAQRND